MMDKNDIINIAMDIGTFETSILPYEDCCTLFVPKSPTTNPNLKIIEKVETSIPEPPARIQRPLKVRRRWLLPRTVTSASLKKSMRSPW